MAEQSNPYSTGGGGVHFEAQIQASFVVLMLSGGYAPCLPFWPIVEIKLQGKIDGFDTDDLIVTVKNSNSNEQRKLLGQIKHSIDITKSSTIFGEVMQAAWNDFNNPNVFTNGDIIALITGSLSATNAEVTWLLNHARANPRDPQRFFRNIQTAKFCSDIKRQKLKIIRDHLRAANSGTDLTDEAFHQFLTHFYLLGYDLGEEEGVVLSLINSHISQFKPECSRHVWSRIMEFTNNRNHHAGVITQDNLPEDLASIFVAKPVNEFPKNLAPARIASTDWTQHSDASYLVLIVLIGSWQDNSESDRNVITQLLGISYDEWLNKAREILHDPDSPLSLKNGVWKVINRIELWNLLGSRILDHNLNTFKSLAVSVLKEPDPAFELPTEKRYAANIYGKVLKHSQVLRNGIAEGLAILGNQSAACVNCSQGHAQSICMRIIQELLTDADWVLWGSLNNFLPALAEAAPTEFLHAVEKTMRLIPCPFDELFAQEGNGITGGNYLTGLLWALEGLAWDEEYLVRACVTLAEIASHDPGGNWANRPANSLVTILLPWLPQTLASVEKRQVTVRTILNEWPDIAWNLIIQLLPDQHRTSSGSHKPSWRKTIPDDWKKGVTNEEYWQQVSSYAELAVAAAGQDTTRICTLIDHLPARAFDQFCQVLISPPMSESPEEQRLSIWNHLRKLTNKHRRFSDAKWVMPDEQITRIEEIVQRLAPTNPFNLYQHLFSDNDFDLYKKNENGEALKMRRESAISIIYEQYTISGVIQFAETVTSPWQVGHALGIIADLAIEQALLPSFLDSTNKQLKALVAGYIARRYQVNTLAWCDSLDKDDWSPTQKGQFLACLPFTQEVWNRAVTWLRQNEREYWTSASVNPYQANGDLTIAIEKLINHNRPRAAINCLDRMCHAIQPIDPNLCIQALRAAVSSSEPCYSMSTLDIVELIQFLQADPLVNKDDLCDIEWAYLSFLDPYSAASPQCLEHKLANEPKFFCEIIQLIYPSNKEDQPQLEFTEESKAIAENAWRLLHEWKTPPGTQQDGTFSGEHFSNWLQNVKEICTESDHLEAALNCIGAVLIYTPADPDGLWIHRAVATALNDREADDMRDSFRISKFNSRGAQWVNPTGEPEKRLETAFRNQANEIENAGFQRLAVTMRDLADSYAREAERIIHNHKDQ